MSRNKKSDIAIIGIGCRLAPNITNVDELWSFLCAEGEAVTDIPEERWSVKRFYAEEIESPSKTYMRRGSFLKRNIHEFEPLFFGISPREAQILDPQQRLLLEVTWEAMETARVLPSRLSGHKTGVFIGIFAIDAHAHTSSPYNLPTVRDHFAATATPSTMLSARLAHVFDFQGPCMSIDTACSSSLVALHQACRALNEGDIDVAISGGVSLMGCPQTSIFMSKGHFIARDGRSKSFDAAADGYGRGEGSVVFILKRLEDAERDGDTIHAIVGATGVNSDGRTQFLTSPDAGAQSRLMTEVLERADVDPRDVAYVETHGTGTPAGDPIETYALSQSIARFKDEKLVIGAVKANLGHTEAAAGALGTLKAALCLRHQAVPPQPGLKTINPSIHLDEWNLEIPRGSTRSLGEGKIARFAGVNSFGYGGTNAIAVLRRPDDKAPVRSGHNAARRINGKIPFLLTAFSKTSLPLMAAAYRERLDGEAQPALGDLAFSLATSRTLFRHRLLVMARDEQELADRLDAYLKDQREEGMFQATVEAESGRGMVFVYSGVGPQWWGMGRYLLREAPQAVLNKARACDALFKALSGYSICEEILREEADSRIDNTAILQPAIFLIQVLVTEYLALQGILPDAVVGHSMGEVAAAYVSGGLSLEDAVTVIYYRSNLQGTLDGTGRMLAVGLSAEAAAELIAAEAPELCVAAVNAPTTCTLAGPEEAIRHLAAHLTQKGLFNRVLNVDVPFHSAVMDRIEGDLKKALSGLAPGAASTPFYSTVYGKLADDDHRADSGYWFSNARQPVLFASAIESCLADGFTQFVEIGPHPVIGRALKSVADKQQAKLSVISTLNRQESEAKSLENAVANIILHTARLDWAAITGGTLIDLPTYRWSREVFHAENERERRFRLGGTGHPLIGFGAMTPGKSWVVDLTELGVPWLKDHCIDNVVLLPAAGFIESALAVGHEIEGQTGVVLENLEILAPLVVQSGDNPILYLDYDESRGTLRFHSAKEEFSEMWIDHGKVDILSAAPWPMPVIDRAMVEQALEQGVDGAGLYEKIRNHGFHYGPRFQTLQRLAVQDRVAYARIGLTEDELGSAEAYYLHPALLDGAMHALIGLVPESFSDHMYVPVGFDRLSCFGMGTTEVLARVEITAITKSQIEASLRLYSTTGMPVAEVKGMRLAEVPRIHKEAATRVETQEYYTKWIESEASILFAEPKTVLLVGHKSTAQKKLCALFEENGVTVLSTPRSGEITPQTIGLKAGLTLDAIIYMAGPAPDADFEKLVGQIDDMVTFGTRLLMEGQDKQPKFIYVSENAIFFDPEDVLAHKAKVHPDGAALVGFFKGLVDERPDLQGKVVDVDTLAGQEALTALAAEILHEDNEAEVALREGRRFTPRFMPVEGQPDRPLAQLPGTPGIKLQKSRTGTLDGLYYKAFDVRPPGRGEITIRVLATSLNFKDMLKGISVLPDKFLLDTYHTTEMGMECCFEVVAVGKGVKNFEVGKRYLTCHPGCFTSHMTLPVKGFRVMALDLFETAGRPLTVAEATGLPIAIATALYCLHDLARLKKNEIVLIHSAAGGVGLAAIEIAKIIGARIFATASSDEKRQILLDRGCEAVWDSRSLAFYDGILEVTGGQGVDVVLNSSPGEIQAHSLALLCNTGRFVEIGKKDIWEKRDLSQFSFNGNVSFHAFDLDLMMARDHRKAVSIFDRIPYLSRKFDTVILPHKVYPASEVRDAFKFMSSSKHIGKILVSYEDLTNVRAQRQPVRPVDPAAAYLVTGGQGGLGLATAAWLAASGARHLHLMGRSVRRDKETLDKIKALKKAGARVTLHYGDVSVYEDVARIKSAILETGIPLKGVFHAAGILDDRLISKYSEESLRNVLKPKVLGGYHLDVLTRDCPLDYFVLYSSIVTVTGNIGQSSYLAANAYLDALASARRKAGFPAVSVQWGPIAEVGMLAQEGSVVQFFENAGFRLLESNEALSLLPTLINRDRDTVAAMAIDWETCFGQHGAIERNPKFALIRREKSIKNTSAQKLAHLQSLSPEERYEFVLDNVKSILGNVLKLEPDSIDPGARPNELGVDSLAGVEIQTAIKTEFNVEISLLVLSRNEPIREIARNVLRQISLNMASA
ncbi:type I polyketide synthase [Asaia bogorensis]|uniref:type I polyketide synthase n=1 Tax=Asaia bogorensis TaxID=91915 RepID=UPI00285E7A27|nr:type I polyketide synthase [Asaia bogorensis]MDR6182816.1 acyl transferase domain-containing protein/NADPH:quinone reductase-like Zn-dependent oxidoreductase/acyl carrier protein [Asaia bogorensis NBRC 16594]